MGWRLRSPEGQGWSLKRQIGALGALALTTLLLAAGLGVLVLRQSESMQVAEAGRQMSQALGRMAGRYEDMRRAFEEQRAVTVLQSGDDGQLRSLTAAALSAFPGMEGGFYAAPGGRLLGYAYPTYSGSGPKTDIPAAEQATIQRVAAAAVAAGTVAEEQVAAGSDLILFRAQPLPGTGLPVAAVWIMDRLSGVRNVRQRLVGLGLLGLMAVSVGVAAGAWLLTRRLDRDVAHIERALRSMEGRLDTSVAAVGVPELERIRSAIVRLAATLLDNQTRRTELERRLNQADRLAALGRLVAGVAHELRNPLASVKLKLQLARRKIADRAGIEQAFDVIDAEIARMDRLIERLLLLAKPTQPSCQPTDLPRFLADRVQLWETRAQAQHTMLDLRPGVAALGPIPLDRDRVGQIMDNLVNNALDAVADRGGRVTVAVEVPSPHEVVVMVDDTGDGVAPEVAGRLFEPFVTTRAGGTGLGLFLSAEMARALGGSLSYESQPGGGARFELRLPC